VVEPLDQYHRCLPRAWCSRGARSVHQIHVLDVTNITIGTELILEQNMAFNPLGRPRTITPVLPPYPPREEKVRGPAVRRSRDADRA